MDAKDRQILAALQEDGRLTNLELSERVALSPSPCLRRLRALEKSGVIQGYTAIVDEQAYGLPLTAFVRIRLDRHSEEAVASFEASIGGMDNILDCYVMTGDADYLLRVLAKDLADYEHFVRSKLHRLKHIASIDTSFAYGVVKRSNNFPKI